MKRRLNNHLVLPVLLAVCLLLGHSSFAYCSNSAGGPFHPIYLASENNQDNVFPHINEIKIPGSNDAMDLFCSESEFFIRLPVILCEESPRDQVTLVLLR